MGSRTYTVVGLGEVLWDLLPSGKQLGGAPANFVYMANLLGARGILASRIGSDPPGEAALAALKLRGVSSSYVQHDPAHPTGTVPVTIDNDGQPEFTITENVAWDFLEWSPQWNSLAADADVVCFGSLAQRCPTSRQTIRSFLNATRSDALRIFDVNLRQSFYSRDVLSESLQLAQVIKLNHEELPKVLSALGIKGSADELICARRLLETFALELVCVTRGAAGSILVRGSEAVEHPGFRVKVADTIGAGDAFTACMAHHYLRGASLQIISDAANRFGAWVASQVGATPSLQGRPLWDRLREIAGD